MRIPPSLIVMSIATAVPFGLAIRDTVKGAPHRLTPDEAAESKLRAEQAEYEAREAAEAKLAEKAHEALVAKLPAIFGPTPASMGTMLAHVKLGGEPPLETWPDGIDVNLDVDNNSTVTQAIVSVSYEDQAACDELRAKLIAAWGAPTNSTWVAADGSQRAHLEDCQLTFEPSLAVAAWLSAVNVLGQSEAKASENHDTFGDERGLQWDLPGLGYGTRSSDVTVSSNKGKISYVNASGETDFDTLVALRDAVSAHLKAQPTVDEDTGDWVWKKAPTARLHRDADTNDFTLSLGKEPTW